MKTRSLTTKLETFVTPVHVENTKDFLCFTAKPTNTVTGPSPIWEQEVARSNRVAPTFFNLWLRRNLASPATCRATLKAKGFHVVEYMETLLQKGSK
jgi:hypothetical protein